MSRIMQRRINTKHKDNMWYHAALTITLLQRFMAMLQADRYGMLPLRQLLIPVFLKQFPCEYPYLGFILCQQYCFRACFKRLCDFGFYLIFLCLYQWQRDLKCGPFSRFTGYIDISVMLFDDPICHGKTESCTLFELRGLFQVDLIDKIHSAFYPALAFNIKMF